MPLAQNIEKNRKYVKYYGLFLMGLVIICFAMFLCKIFYIQITDVESIRKDYISKNYRKAKLSAARGNLFASDGSILATTVMRYDVYLDFKSMRDSLYSKNIDALSDSLSKMLDKPSSYFKVKFEQEKKKKNQYYSLIRGLDYDQYARIKQFPIFNKGKNKGGFIVERTFKREFASSQIGSGTIGVDDGEHHSGLEYAFRDYLRGKDGERLEQRISNSQWKPIDYWQEKNPEDGQDVFTTLDLRIQDIAHSALEKQLKAFKAHHGSVLVIETKTGKVRAMVNLAADPSGEFKDSYNYAIKDATEPGSTFKSVSLLAAMDDGFIDANSTVNVGGGNWEYYGQPILDGHGGGTYDISDVLAKSSNVGTAKIITKHYGDNPEIFYNHLRRWKMFEKLDIELPGISKPYILTPKDKKWTKGALASLSFGYASRFNMLQLATFYNGIANGGEMLKPIFIEKRMKDGQVLYEAKKQVLVDKMASKEAIEQITSALTKAVEKGTAKSIFTPNLKMAGKTGTARFEYWKAGPMKYQASFIGFYPSDNPQYTCYVLINQPDTSLGFYGALVAAPVFKEIAGKTFLKQPMNIEKQLVSAGPKKIQVVTRQTPKLNFSSGVMPNLVGFIGRDAIPQIENKGFRVSFQGTGKIVKQFPEAGTPILKKQKVYLELSQ